MAAALCLPWHMELPPLPSLESLRSRLALTRQRAHVLVRLEPGRPALSIVGHALEDLNDAERLLDQPNVDEKPQVLHSADMCIDVAEWRLRGVQQMIDKSSR